MRKKNSTENMNFTCKYSVMRIRQTKRSGNGDSKLYIMKFRGSQSAVHAGYWSQS